MAQVTFEQAAAAIDDDRLVSTLSELIAIPSVNPFDEESVAEGQGEVAAARYVADRLGSLGWSCKVDEFASGRANVLCAAPGRSDGSRKAVMFAGHLDTVQVEGYDKPFEARVEAGRVHGRGACDMKGAVACYLEVAYVLRDLGVELAGPLLIGGVADEEYRQSGAKALRDQLPAIELVVIGEPTELRICTAAKGLAAYTLSVSGEATHGSVPGAGKNAILRAGELMVAFPRHVHTLGGHRHPLLGPGVINLGTIEGGLKPNIVPSSCSMGLSRRLLPEETAESARSLLVRDIEAAAGAETDWELSSAWWTVEPYENADAEIVAAFQQAAETARVPDIAIAGFPASSDAAYFGAPVVIFGPGSLDQAHSLDEWVAVDEMIAATRTYLRFALDRLSS